MLLRIARVLMICLVLVVLSACGVGTPLLEITPTEPVELSQMSTSTIEPQSSVTPLPQAPRTTQTPISTELTVERRCASQVSTTLTSLSIDPTYGLLVRLPATESERFVVVGSNMDTKPLELDPTIDRDSIQIVGVSPDNVEIAVAGKVKDVSGRKLWISKSGKVFTEPTSDDFAYAYTFWPSRDVMVVGEAAENPTDFPGLDAVINLRQQVTQKINRIYLDLGIFAFDSTGTRVITLGGSPLSLFLYDIGGNLSGTRVLPWTSEYNISAPGDASTAWNTSGVSVALMDASSIAFVIGIPETELAQTDVSVNKLSFNSPSDSWGVIWWASDHSRLALIRSFLSGEANGPRYNVEFYLLDTGSRTILDYCLPSNLTPGRIVASPDSRFLAWTVQDGSTKQVLVLDTNTGSFALLDQFIDVLGWVVEPAR